MVLLLDVPLPGPDVHTFREPARDRNGVVRAFRIDDDDLIGPREGCQRVGNRFGLVLRDDDGGHGRHCSGIVYYAVDMEQNEALDLYRRTGAYLEGHFRLSSGLHSPGYMQSALVLQYPKDAESLGTGIASHVRHLNATLVLSPALGGLIIGHEVARALGVRAMFAERAGGTSLTLRRGFTLSPDERVLVVEDVFTTGKSTRETVDVAREAGGNVVGAAAIVDRSGGTIDLSV